MIREDFEELLGYIGFQSSPERAEKLTNKLFENKGYIVFNDFQKIFTLEFYDVTEKEVEEAAMILAKDSDIHLDINLFKSIIDNETDIDDIEENFLIGQIMNFEDQTDPGQILIRNLFEYYNFEELREIVPIKPYKSTLKTQSTEQQKKEVAGNQAGANKQEGKKRGGGKEMKKLEEALSPGSDQDGGAKIEDVLEKEEILSGSGVSLTGSGKGLEKALSGKAKANRSGISGVDYDND